MLTIIITFITGIIIGSLLYKRAGDIYWFLQKMYIIVFVFFMRVGYRLRTGKSYRKELRKRELKHWLGAEPQPREYFEGKDYDKEWIDDYYNTYKDDTFLDKLLKFRRK